MRKNQIVWIVIFVYIFLILNIDIIPATTTTDAITSTIDSGSEKLAVDYINKVYEISENTLSSGFNTNMDEKNAFRIYIHDQKYYLILWNMTLENVGIMTSNKKFGTLLINQSKVVDLNDDSIPEVILTLNEIINNSANITIKEYSSRKNLDNITYKELFDVTLELKDDKIKNTKDLIAYINFVNFGEGASSIKIFYTITSLQGKEMYEGVDEKVVYTEESLIKSFDFITLNPGKYILKTKIFYGDNQTAESEKDFEILEVNQSQEYLLLFVSLSIIVFLVFIMLFIRKKFILDK